MTQILFKTTCQKEREVRDLSIYEEWNDLIAIDGQSKTRVLEFLMSKYGIHSQATIYAVIKRVNSKLKKRKETK